MSRFFAGMVCGAGLVLLAMHYHIVRGNDGVFLVPKISSNLTDTYVDIRDFRLGDWQEHKSVAAALVKNNRSDQLEGASLDTVKSKIGGVVDGFFD